MRSVYQEKYLYTHKAIYSKVNIPGEFKFSITFSYLYTIQPSIDIERDITSTVIDMSLKTKSIREIKKIQRKLELHDKQLAHAVDYARKHPDESKAKVAKTFGVSAVTLRRRCKGTPSKAIARQEQQLLIAGEEDAVADWCRIISDRYFLVTMLMLVYGCSYLPVFGHSVRRFLNALLLRKNSRIY